MKEKWPQLIYGISPNEAKLINKSSMIKILYLRNILIRRFLKKWRLFNNFSLHILKRNNRLNALVKKREKSILINFFKLWNSNLNDVKMRGIKINCCGKMMYFNYKIFLSKLVQKSFRKWKNNSKLYCQYQNSLENV